MTDIRPADSSFSEPPREERVPIPREEREPAARRRSEESVPACDFTLVGRTLEGHRRFPIGTILTLVVGIASLLVAAVSANGHFALFALLPLFSAAALWL